MKIDLTLVIPCYNEAPHLEKNIKKIIWVLSNMHINFEMILIDDCSKDDTVKKIKKIVSTYKNIKFRQVFHKQNVGRGGTVSDGIKQAKGRVVGFVDIDLEVSEHYIPSFYWKINEGFDLAIAKRSYDFTFSKLFRFFGSKCYATLVKNLLNSPYSDTEAGYKFFNRKEILSVLNQVNDTHWFWDTEIVIRSHLANLKLVEIPVIFIRNPEKKSTVKIIPDSIEYFKKLLAFKKEIFKN